MIPRREEGLALVDVLVSLAVLAVIGLGVMTMATVSLHLGKMGEERSTATGLAAERLDKLASLPFQSAADYQNYRLPEETADAGPPRTLTADYGTIPDYPGYRRVVVLEYDTPYAGMLSAEVTVSWSHTGKGVKSHTMVTYIHPGLKQ